jgi:hypothetical protein
LFSFGDPQANYYSRVPVNSTRVSESQLTFTVPADADCGLHFVTVVAPGIPEAILSKPVEFTVTSSCNADRRNSLDVLTYNIQMLPDAPGLPDPFHKDYRAPLIALHPLLQKHDVIVFVEAFSDSHRGQINEILRPSYPYQGRILGTDHGLSQDGGVIILSKWPIEAQNQLIFGVCSGFFDCHADKGVNYARINKAGSTSTYTEHTANMI